MNTRITVDLKDPNLVKTLHLESIQENKALREIMVEALHGYFSNKLENRGLTLLAEKSFAEWENSKDAEYDHL